MPELLLTALWSVISGDDFAIPKFLWHAAESASA